MPLLMGTRGDEILQWSSGSQLLVSLREKLAGKWEQIPLTDTAQLLKKFQGALSDELALETQVQAELETLLDQLGRSSTPQELGGLLLRGTEIAAAHFASRRSILALFEICNLLHDRALERALTLAREAMRDKGQGTPPPFGLLVSGDRGRGEQTLASRNRYFLLHQGSGERFYLFCRCLSEVLGGSGLLPATAPIWHGSLHQWRDWLREMEAPPGGSEFPEHLQLEERLEILADLVPLSGEPALGSEALELACQTLHQQRLGEPFYHVARRAISLPVALGLFGRFRVLRSGEHRGEIDLDELALAPLNATLRILALRFGIGATGTQQRIARLLERGELDVELAERLLKAFQCLIQLKISSETGERNPDHFSNPESFSAAQQEDFRLALEGIIALQKIAYQKLFGQG